MLYIEATEINIHPFGADGVEACSDSGGSSNREKHAIAILLHVYKVDEAIGSGD